MSDCPNPSPTCEMRCLCGSLLARLVAQGVELKCRRCKRATIVPLEPSAEGTAAPLPTT